jgi:divalent metal cation (Fe/Co/Zn/Cd) transporter
MSKNELRVLAKIMLIGVGLYVLLQTALSVLATLPLMLTVARNEATNAMTITAMAIYFILALGAVYFLVRVADRISSRIVESEPVDDTQISWLAVAFRLVCVTAGILFIYWTFFGSIATIAWYISAKLSHQMTSIYQNLLPEVVKCVLMLGMGIYLAYGAPGFVRWQVKKTLKQCSKIEEQQPMRH